MKIIQKNTIALLAIASSATAQEFTAQPLEAEAGTSTELIVNVAGVGTMTALQFNLELPEGVTIADGNATMGEATDGHTLCMEALDNGDHLFILYSMDLKTFKDGELLRIPVNMNSEASEGIARLYTSRFADTNAESYAAAETESIVTGIPSMEDGKSKTKDGSIYNLAGQMVNGKLSNGKLPRGINIKDGKKVVVK